MVDLGGGLDVGLVLLDQVAEQLGLVAQGHVHVVEELLDVVAHVLAVLLEHRRHVVVHVLRAILVGVAGLRTRHCLHLLIATDDVHVVAAEGVLIRWILGLDHGRSSLLGLLRLLRLLDVLPLLLVGLAVFLLFRHRRPLRTI